MKTYPLIALLAAFVAFSFSTISFEFAVSLLFAAGIGAVMHQDYTREASRLVARRVRIANLPLAA